MKYTKEFILPTGAAILSALAFHDIMWAGTLLWITASIITILSALELIAVAQYGTRVLADNPIFFVSEAFLLAIAVIVAAIADHGSFILCAASTGTVLGLYSAKASNES